MKKYSAFLLITLILTFTAFAQKMEAEVTYEITNASNTKPVIFYTPGNKLTWNDFNGKPDVQSDAVSISNAGIGFNMAFYTKYNLTTLKILVDCNFSKADSWVKKGNKTNYILNHEQHHFDIAYIFAMKLIHDLKAAKYNKKDYSNTIERIYNTTQAALLTMQNQYDAETKNGKLVNEQALWNKKIDEQVDSISKQ